MNYNKLKLIEHFHSNSYNFNRCKFINIEKIENNLREMIGSNNILNKKVIYKKTTIKSTKFCQPYNINSNLCCKHHKSTIAQLAGAVEYTDCTSAEG